MRQVSSIVALARQVATGVWESLGEAAAYYRLTPAQYSTAYELLCVWGYYGEQRGY